MTQPTEAEVEAAATEIEVESLRFGFLRPEVCRAYARAALTAAAQVTERAEPTEFMLTNIARAIGNTITTANHFERAKQVWAAAMSSERQPKPSGRATENEVIRWHLETILQACDKPSCGWYSIFETTIDEARAALTRKGEEDK